MISVNASQEILETEIKNNKEKIKLVILCHLKICRATDVFSSTSTAERYLQST